MADVLPDWRELDRRIEWRNLLTGNGLSLGVWDGFAYGSLFDAATSQELDPHLDAADVALFDQLRTRNFEIVLYKLLSAISVARALGDDPALYEERYEHIRLALIAAVHHMHVPWWLVADEDGVLSSIRDELRKYRQVFSTNYDLLIYWAAMLEDRAKGFRDFFWTNDETSVRFDLNNTEVYDRDATILAYPHGALHLVHSADGAVHKLCSSDMKSILDQFGEPLVADAVPLIVTEGDSEAKLQSIRSADYLGYVFKELSELTQPLVVFGHSLGESDTHLVSAIRGYRGDNPKTGKPMVDWNKKDRDIAISIWPQERDIQAEMARYRALFPEANLHFFNSETHPLGDPSLHVELPATLPAVALPF